METEYISTKFYSSFHGLILSCIPHLYIQVFQRKVSWQVVGETLKEQETNILKNNGSTDNDNFFFIHFIPQGKTLTFVNSLTIKQSYLLLTSSFVVRCIDSNENGPHLKTKSFKQLESRSFKMHKNPFRLLFYIILLLFCIYDPIFKTEITRRIHKQLRSSKIADSSQKNNSAIFCISNCS